MDAWLNASATPYQPAPSYPLTSGGDVSGGPAAPGARCEPRYDHAVETKAGIARRCTCGLLRPSNIDECKPFPLLRLPVEIRLKIYRWVLLLGIADPPPKATATRAAGQPVSSPSSGVPPTCSYDCHMYPPVSWGGVPYRGLQSLHASYIDANQEIQTVSGGVALAMSGLGLQSAYPYPHQGFQQAAGTTATVPVAHHQSMPAHSNDPQPGWRSPDSGSPPMPMSTFGGRAHQNAVQYRTVAALIGSGARDDDSDDSDDGDDNEDPDEDEDEDDEDDEETSTSGDDDDDGDDDDGGVALLPAYRPVGRALPVGLLLACRQVYAEARTVAFEEGEFVFAKTFSPALATAHGFVVLGSKQQPAPAPPTIAGATPTPAPAPPPPLLQPWQRDSIRYVRMELRASAGDMGWRWIAGAVARPRDPRRRGWPDRAFQSLDPSGFLDLRRKLDRDRWTALCGGLAHGLRGLRLRLAASTDTTGTAAAAGFVIAGSAGSASSSGGSSGGDGGGDKTAHSAAAAAAGMAASPLVRGLRRLKALRQLEVELVWKVNGAVFDTQTAAYVGDSGLNPRPASRAAARAAARAIRAANVAWCAAVETALNGRTRAEELAERGRHGGCGGRPLWTSVVCVERIPEILER